MTKATNKNELLWAQLDALEKRNASLTQFNDGLTWEEFRANCAAMVAIFEELRH